MSGSDILAIQLWLGASAIAFLAVAMTAAGWNHKIFVSSMFGLAGLFAFNAIFWHQILLFLPAQAEANIASVANSKLTWLAIFIAGMGAVLLVARLRGWSNKPNVPRPLPTHVRVQFPGSGALPTIVDEQNIWRWYALASWRVTLAPGQPPQHILENWTLFVIFDRPILFKQIRMDSGGTPIPRWEVKDSGPRHALILI